jgi:hypothetical protein
MMSYRNVAERMNWESYKRSESVTFVFQVRHGVPITSHAIAHQSFRLSLQVEMVSTIQ